jgi:hypothetical protein
LETYSTRPHVRRVLGQRAADALDVGVLRRRLEVHVDDDALAHLVGGARRRLHDRDEHAEDEDGDEHGRQRGEARDRVAVDRAQRLAEEEADPHRTGSPRSSAPNSAVVSGRR